MLAATAVAILGLPLLVPLAIAADLVRLRWRLPSLRVYLFVLQYLVNDTVEILLAPLYWLLAGAGTRLGSEASIRRHERLQAWSIGLLERRAERLLGLQLAIDHSAPTALGSGPIIVISRHVSLFDASLPSVVLTAGGFRVRGVMMAEMLADPGFDLIYARTGSVFVPRDRGAEARAEIAAMAASADSRTALVIFPEGRLFRDSVRHRLLARLAETDPERGRRLAGLQNLLPPRPGGLLALLDAVPDADVVVIDHRGFERFRSLTELASAVPVEQPIRIGLRRIARTEIPDDPEGRLEWLDELWLDLDRTLDGESAGQLGGESAAESAGNVAGNSTGNVEAGLDLDTDA